MRTRRLALAGALTAVIAAGGCADKQVTTGIAEGGSGAPAASATTTTTAPATPGAELEAAAVKLSDAPVKVDVVSVAGVTITGAFDAKAQRGDMTMELGPAGGMSMKQLGNDLYVQVKGAMANAVDDAAARKWMHIDLSTVPESSSLNIKNNDPRVTAKLLTSAMQVKKTGEHTFSGTVDLTKSPTYNAQAAKGLAAKMKAVPFTAETDTDGRLAELTFDMEKIAPGAGEMITRYSDFGVPVAVKAPPAAQVVEMPASFRKAMGA
ncbi:hypothetical protein Aab01nite_21100 [Paractinoplanes abujensis]|uniref:Lipoprotein n=1 Tax=Paractinoplanes abujensis TaxID=882441 RepID=A0A7W7CYI9_9ACTN|nr:hypothetical protein [Actinoplanes abujensis]MBB4697006.1 hypothetical protein [Actinoplanes abujensis]GID18520.1 hypothetical protein Aab01nite_21100 [Actinoplanes abujensis]